MQCVVTELKSVESKGEWLEIRRKSSLHKIIMYLRKFSDVFWVEKQSIIDSVQVKEPPPAPFRIGAWLEILLLSF